MMKNMSRKVIAFMLLMALCIGTIGVSPTQKAEAATGMTRESFIIETAKAICTELDCRDRPFYCYFISNSSIDFLEADGKSKDIMADTVNAIKSKYSVTLYEAQWLALAETVGLFSRNAAAYKSADKMKSSITYRQALTILVKADNYLNGTTFTNAQLKTLKKGISNISKAGTTTSQNYMAKAYGLGFYIGTKSGKNTSTRTFKYTAKPSQETCEELISRLTNVYKRYKVSDGRVVTKEEKPTADIDNLYYCLVGNEIHVYGNKNEVDTLVIPEEINGYPVTQIIAYGDMEADKAGSSSRYKHYDYVASAFKVNDTVILPDTIEYIGDCAFLGCKISHISIPGSVKEIRKWAFTKCNRLESVEMLEGIQVLNARIFDYCYALKSLNIPKSVTQIGDESNGAQLARECYNLKNLTVSEGNPVYDSRDNCNAIIETGSDKLIMACSATVIPDGVRIIGDHSFAYICSGNGYVPGSREAYCDPMFGPNVLVIPDSVKKIEENAFCFSDLITEVVIPDGVTEIGSGTFLQCKVLEKVTLPKGTTELPFALFSACEHLHELVIPDGVTSIGESAIDEIAIISIPPSVKFIHENAIYFRCMPEKIYVQKDSYAAKWAVENGYGDVLIYKKFSD